MRLPTINMKQIRFRTKINFPISLSKDLAEEIGIHIGDGSLFFRKKENHYDYVVCLSREEESYKNYVINLIKKIYGIVPSYIDKDKTENSINIEYYSKLLFLWKKSIGLPISDKSEITIPKFVLDSFFVIDCLRGIFDTDGSVTFKKKNQKYHSYPVLKIDNKSSKLVLQINLLLKKIGISSSFQLNKIHVSSNRSTSPVSTVYFSGKSNLLKWFNLVSSKNEIHTTKYKIWKKFGFCPPKTTLKQRKLILSGDLSPEKNYVGDGI